MRFPVFERLFNATRRHETLRRVVRWLRRPPRGWRWAGGIAGATLLVAYGTAFLTDEPLRRYVESEVNRRLSGYTVRIQQLSLHPLGFSFDLKDATIVQSANPDPPVAHIERLHTTLHWRALLDGRVVADLTFDRPKVHVDLSHVRTEMAGTVALKDRGWQRALEAVALDLEINRLRVVDGDLTYVDRGPFRPLRLSALAVSAENIRNIRSKDRAYPSDIHLQGVVFDTGRLWVDGHADFLAEPHPGVLARIRLDRIALDYFRPITDRVNLSVRNGALTALGTAEYAPSVKTVTLEHVLVDGAEVEYVHTAETAAVERARAQTTVRVAKEVANDPSVRLRIDRMDVVKSRFGFLNRAATPPYRVVLADAALSAEKLSNQRSEGPGAVRLTGKFMGTGATRVWVTVRPETRGAETALKVQVQDTDMVGMNDLIRAHGGFDVAAGRFSMYAELRVKEGAVDGYVKPLFQGVKVPAQRREPPEGLRQQLYEGLVNVAAKLLENRSRREVATVATVSGSVDRLEVSTWNVVGRLLQNAFLKAILPGFESSARSGAEGNESRSTVRSPGPGDST